MPGIQNPGSAAASLPKVAAEPNPAPQPAPGRGTEAAADRGPLNRQMVGTQMLGLAALCAAVGIVIARLTLRGHRPAGQQTGQQAAQSASQQAEKPAGRHSIRSRGNSHRA